MHKPLVWYHKFKTHELAVPAISAFVGFVALAGRGVGFAGPHVGVRALHTTTPINVLHWGSK